jgi:hypothetical protein
VHEDVAYVALSTTVKSESEMAEDSVCGTASNL